MLNRRNARGKLFSRVTGLYRNTPLQENWAGIRTRINEVHRAPALFITAGKHTLVNPETIHAGTAVPREQRRVQIDHRTFKPREQRFAHNGEETGKDDCIHTGGQARKNGGGQLSPHGGSVQLHEWNACRPRSPGSPGPRAVRDHSGNSELRWVIAGGVDERLEIGAPAGGEDRHGKGFRHGGYPRGR